MEHLILISTNSKQFIDNKKITYGQNYLSSFRKFFPDNFDPEKITEGIIYFNGTKNNKQEEKNIDQKPLKILIKKLKLTPNYIFIEFDISNHLEFDSQLIKELLRLYLKSTKNITQNEITPYFAIVEKNRFYELLENEKINAQISVYEKNSEWEKLVRLFEPLDKIEETDIWYNTVILNKIGFALTRLSECSVNLKKQFSDPKKRNNFLNQKRYYRINCEKIYNRLIEIDNLNPSYYSSKAYFHYQNLSELIYPGGRRDGNFFDEVQKALDNFENAIDLDYSRINDHYRKGYLLAVILPERITFAPDQNNIPERFKNKKLLIEEGILSFERILKIYEDSTASEDFKKRYFNTYLKTIYNLASVFQSIVINKNEKLTKLIIKIFPELTSDFEIDYTPFEYKINNLKKSLEYFEKFVRWVNKKFISKDEEQDLIEIIKYEDSLKSSQSIIQPRLKAYQLGKIYYELFLTTNDQTYLQQAKRSLLLATQLKKKSPEDRDYYIHNLLALIYIFENKFDMSIRLLEDIQRRSKLDDYIKITLMIAYITQKEIEKANRVLNSLLEKGNSIFKKELMFWKLIINEINGTRDYNLSSTSDFSTQEKQTQSEEKNFEEEKNKSYQYSGSSDIYSRIIFKVLNRN